jgi:SAM-dependent methyltransferase
MESVSKESLQENQYHFPYHHLADERDGSFYIFRHLFWGLEHYTYIKFVIQNICVNTPPTSKIADVGCGEGRVLTELTKVMPESKLYGYDVSETALIFARGFTKKPVFSVHDITASALPEKFDLIVSCEVIEHIKPDEVDKYCKNIAESLTEGGNFILTTPTTNAPLNPKHYQHFNEEILKRHLQPYFDIVEVAYLNRISKYGRLLNFLIANRFYLSNHKRINKWILKQYTKHVLNAEKYNGARIFVNAKKRT